MKKILLILSMLFAITAQAQTTNVIRNDSAATVIQSNNLGNSKLSTDSTGKLFVTVSSSSGLSQSVFPISNNTSLNGVGAGLVGWSVMGSDTAETASTTTLINATAHIARAGDAVIFSAGTAANIGAWSPICSVTTNSLTLCNALPVTPSNGDAFRIERPSLIGMSSATGTGGGSLNVSLSSAFALDSTSPVRAEDSAFGASEGVMVSGGQAMSAIVQSVGSSGDVAPPSMDLGNRTVVTNAPAGEFFSSCGTATATTADTSMKNSVASNRMYVTSITCKNSSASTGTAIDFKDGSTIIAVGGIGEFTAASTGNPSFVATFPTPLRGTSATALNFATNTAVSSVTCCAAGYISTI